MLKYKIISNFKIYVEIQNYVKIKYEVKFQNHVKIKKRYSCLLDKLPSKYLVIFSPFKI